MNKLTQVRDWPRVAIEALAAHPAIVRVVVAKVRGSAPREVGACMIVDSRSESGTIGGGNLEHVSIEIARGMLRETSSAAVACEHFVLATHLAQCCGGVVDVWFERYERADLPLLFSVQRASRAGTSSFEVKYTMGRVERRVVASRLDAKLARGGERITWREPLIDLRPNVWVFGAGHVGQALVRTLMHLPVAVTWVESRPEFLPQALEHVALKRTSDPVGEVAYAPDGTHFLVMTHDHALDYALCQAILERKNAATAGVIGSQSKSARFRSRLAREGVSRDAIAMLRCPIGIDGIHSKEPSVIAVAVSAQLLRDIDGIEKRSANGPHAASACAAADANGQCTGCLVSKVAS